MNLRPGIVGVCHPFCHRPPAAAAGPLGRVPWHRVWPARDAYDPGVKPGCRLCRRHGSLEGVGGLKTNEAYHSKADALVIPDFFFFWKFIYALFWKCWFCKIRHLLRFACATGYDTGWIRANRIWNASSHLAQQRELGYKVVHRSVCRGRRI